MEGPSLVILKEELAPFLGQKISKVTGNTKQPKNLLKGRTLSKIETWGKVLFLSFSSTRSSEAPLVVKTHFLMFGSYRINDPKEDRDPRLEMTFKNGLVSFYSCSVLFHADELLAALDKKVDVMSNAFNEKHVLKLMAEKKDPYLCDLFLDQTLFAGSGNIVKNEVLFNIRRHPLTKLSQISRSEWPALVRAIHDYCWNFYVWKKKFELRRHWQVYKQRKCKLCGETLKSEKIGKGARRTYYCETHQALKTRRTKLIVCPVLPIKEKTHRPEKRLDH